MRKAKVLLKRLVKEIKKRDVTIALIFFILGLIPFILSQYSADQNTEKIIEYQNQSFNKILNSQDAFLHGTDDETIMRLFSKIRDITTNNYSSVQLLNIANKSIDKSEEFFLKALNYSINGDFKKSLIYYNLSIEYDPYNADIRYHKGNSYYYLNQFNEALASYNEAINLSLTFEDAWIARGHAYASLGQMDKSLDSYRYIVEKINPNNADAWFFIGLTYYLRASSSFLECTGTSCVETSWWVISPAVAENCLSAIAAFNRSIEINPQADNSWTFKCETFELLGNMNRVSGYYSNMSGNNEALDYYNSMSGNYSESLNACDNAIGINPNNFWAWEKKAEILRLLGRAEEAKEATARADQILEENE